ncbi:MAG TPA: MAPEG family protein, partial [Gemmatimonadaceae bacterium]|nr:MAPEG family protein [Gemmatimonadaceae bacterium]
MFVTPLYAGLLALWFLVLSWRVIQRRGKGNWLGDGGDQALLRVIRGHANFAEYVPLALLMMGFLEVSRFSIYALHALGIVLLIARLLHGYALSFTE